MKPKLYLPLFLVAQLLFLQIVPYFSSEVESLYSTGIYPYISRFLRVTFGNIPFSIGDFWYMFTAVYVLYWICKTRKSWRNSWKDNSLKVLSFISVFYFLFHFLWAMNYYREPLFIKMNIKKEYSKQDLLAFTKQLIEKTNNIQYQITSDNNKKVTFPYSHQQVFDMNTNGYKNLAKKYSYFRFNTISSKKSLYSLPLTYMGFSGYLNPFTNEAQVNDLGPMYSFPMTTNHEMAHQMGFASESECNFIGYLASIKNDNLYFQFSGYSFALRYCLGIWSNTDKVIYKELVKTIHPGILINYKESENFWREYDTVIEAGFHSFYDNFLKLNQQKEGIESYGKFVNLMVNYYKREKL